MASSDPGTTRPCHAPSWCIVQHPRRACSTLGVTFGAYRADDEHSAEASVSKCNLRLHRDHWIARGLSCRHMSKTHRALEAIAPQQRVASAPTNPPSGFESRANRSEPSKLKRSQRKTRTAIENAST